MTDISKFFTALSERAYKENDLSDVTYAMCEADPVFKQFFLDFFFEDQELKAEDCSITREVAYPDGARPDLVVRDKNGQAYFVEVKIWDGSHHFAQYKNTLCGQEKVDDNEVGKHFGYIANYVIEKDQLSGEDQKVYEKMTSRVKTWREFAETLKKSSALGESTVKAYVEYLVRVCPYDDFTIGEKGTINVSGFKTVSTFYKTISDILENKLKGVVPYNGSSRQFQSMRRMGRYFEYTKFKESESSDESSVWGWLGVVYEKIDNSWGARVCVEFEQRTGWGEKVCDKYNKLVKDGVLRFYYDGELNETGILEFLKNVLNKVNKEESECSMGHKNFAELLAMKTLPFAIEKYFYGKLNNDWMIERGYDSDEENPNSHCGRYFKLRRISKSGDALSAKDDIPLGWVGVVFDDKAHFDVKAGGEPVFVVQLPKCEGVFNLNGWTQDQCSNYWWNMRLNPNSCSAIVGDFAKAFRVCLENVLSK